MPREDVSSMGNGYEWHKNGIGVLSGHMCGTSWFLYPKLYKKALIIWPLLHSTSDFTLHLDDYYTKKDYIALN